MPWVTSKRHPKRGVHQIPDQDFDPRRHTRVKPPKDKKNEAAPVAGTGAPEVSVQEQEEAAKAAAEFKAAKPKAKAKKAKPASGAPAETPAEDPASAE